MVYYRNLVYFTLVLLLACGVFGSLIQWSSITTKQLTTVFEDPTNVNTENCGTPDDILEIDDIKIMPSVISPGKEFTIEANGKLKESIEYGAEVRVTIKIGRAVVYEDWFNLCKTLEEKEGNDIRCPIPAGDIKISQKFNLPKEIPFTYFDIFFRAYTNEEEDIGCLEASVDFE